MAKRKVIVIGGGAAGLIAAGQAASLGAETWLLEKKYQPGRKLRITGKGRCNLTNSAPLLEFISHYGSNGRFLRQAYSRFFSHDLITFLTELGVETEVERGGRVFPKGNDAQEVVNALIQWAGEEGVNIRANTAVAHLVTKGGRIMGVRTTKRNFEADNIILAAGGASYPATGSTGDSYRLAESIGHTIVPIRPALVPLETAGDIAPRLEGLSLRNVELTVHVEGKKKATRFGDMLFTDTGVSGPIILSVSRLAVDALRAGKEVTISIDFKPALDDRKLEARLLRDLKSHGKQKFVTLLKELLPRRLIDICVELTGISADKTGSQITTEERKRLRAWLKNFRLEVTGHRSFDEAIITAGGVSLSEVNPRTMESKLVKGLYFAGEVLDLDGDTGGYNLQAAFSTGWLAGMSAAQ